MNCDYCDSIERMTGRRHCPIHPEFLETPRGDPEFQSRIDAERCTRELATKSTKRVDSGKRPIEESPLFGGGQKGLFDEG
jgi:hypothetical protein